MGGVWGGKGSDLAIQAPPSRPKKNRDYGVNFASCEFRDEFFVNFYIFYGYSLALGCIMRDIRKGAALRVARRTRPHDFLKFCPHPRDARSASYARAKF